MSLCFSSGGQAQSVKDSISSLDFSAFAHRKSWLNQLHYRKNIFGHWRSEADGKAFFLSPHGKNSPVDELKATLDMFLRAPETPWGYVNQPVICAFPTRRKFLEEEMGFHFREVPCPDRENWIKAFGGGHFFLIFSDSYPNNPASMFGHTFVLISKADPPDSAEGLLSYSINYSADTSTADEKSIFYTLRGILGGYEGRYGINPFYQMINQYTKWDSRDLWYLKLPWGRSEITRFLNHVWEIFTTTHFDYFFFDENCSYRLLSAIEYADPNLELIEKFPLRFPTDYVSPIATYKAVYKEYELKSKVPMNEYYSPSIQKLLHSQLSTLTESQNKQFRHLKNNLPGITSESDPQVLDSLIAHFDYQKRVLSANYLPSTTLGGLRTALKRRAELGGASIPPRKPIRPASPLLTHGEHSIFIGNDRFGGSLGYHDLMSPSPGYQNWSHLVFFQTEFNLKNNEIQLASFLPVSLISFFPVNQFESKFSWLAEAGYSADYYTYAKTGAGLSFLSESRMSLAYFFLSPIVSTHEALTSSRGLLLQPEIGVAKELLERFKIWFLVRDLLRGPRWSFDENLESYELRVSAFLSRSDELRFSSKIQVEGHRHSLSWQHNF